MQLGGTLDVGVGIVTPSGQSVAQALSYVAKFREAVPITSPVAFSSAAPRPRIDSPHDTSDVAFAANSQAVEAWPIEVAAAAEHAVVIVAAWPLGFAGSAGAGKTTNDAGSSTASRPS